MAIIKSRTFTVPAGGARVQVSAAFEAASGGTASDWGSGVRYQLSISEYQTDGTTLVTTQASQLKPVTTTRARYTDLVSGTYKIAAGQVCKVALNISTGPGQTATAWNVDMRTEVIRR